MGHDRDAEICDLRDARRLLGQHAPQSARILGNDYRELPAPGRCEHRLVAWPARRAAADRSVLVLRNDFKFMPSRDLFADAQLIDDACLALHGGRIASVKGCFCHAISLVSSAESAVRELFERHGAVVSVTLPTDRDTGRLRGFGFVEMPDQDATKALAALNGEDFGGRD